MGADTDEKKPAPEAIKIMYVFWKPVKMVCGGRGVLGGDSS
jgi:hypothetical protein